MATQQTIHPVVRTHVGCFQISIWKRKTIIAAKNGFVPERKDDILRACIQYGRFNRTTATWETQIIWCKPEDLRALVNVLDYINNNNRGP